MQGTVLELLMFLLYVNDISNNLTSHITLFADDCIIHRTIPSPEDSLHLQEDLDRILIGLHIGKYSLMSRNVLSCDVLDHILLKSQIML